VTPPGTTAGSAVVSPGSALNPFDGPHGRARELAALRIDEPLPAAEDAWPRSTSPARDPCTRAAAEYGEQSGLLSALRGAGPLPPRDLWARTSAALEAEAGSGRRPRDTRPERRWLPGLPLAPMAAVMVVAIAVGAGLLNGISLFPPHESTTKGDDGAMPTPIALTAGQVQVLSRGADGTLELSTKDIDEVCPMGAEACGTSTDTAETTIDTLADLGSFDAVISPDRDRIVLMQLTARPAALRRPGRGPTTRPRRRRHAHPVAATARPCPPTRRPRPRAQPPHARGHPGRRQSPSPEPTPETSPENTARATPEPTEAPPPRPRPTVAVTPAPTARSQIASDVILVGTSRLLAGRHRFAFTARPATAPRAPTCTSGSPPSARPGPSRPTTRPCSRRGPASSCS